MGGHIRTIYMYMYMYMYVIWTRLAIYMGTLPPSPCPAVSGAAQIMGDLVTGRVAETRGQSLSIPFNERDGAGKYSFIADVLRWRAQTSPDNQLFSVVDAKVPVGSISLVMICSISLVMIY